jgi:lactoylglutathione lyase
MTFAYMGHSQGGRNGTGYQTTEEMIRNKPNSAGLLEFVYFHTSTPGQKPLPGPDSLTSTFNHIGMIVPDPEATQKRLEDYGVTIYKKLGAEWPSDGPYGTPYSLGDAAGLSEDEWEEIKKGMTNLNKLNIFAGDPDGNLIEILPLNEPPETIA